MRRKQGFPKKPQLPTIGTISLLDKLKELSPLQFEHLTYDLSVLSGLRNAVWRTPGPDAGRDIEGEVVTSDMSETMVVQRWYIECKRYAESIDWPTVYDKIAYAHNHGVDYLLFVTTATLSPRCREELSKRELRKAQPFVRAWDAPLLEVMVARYPLLLVKYGLTDEEQPLAESMLPLINIASKSIQSAYGTASLRDHVDPALEFSVALVDLISARLAGAYSWGKAMSRRTVPTRDIYPWVKMGKGVKLEACDSYGLRALLSAIRFFWRMEKIILTKSTSGICRVHLSLRENSTAAGDVLAVISLWSNLEVHLASGAIDVLLRREDAHG